MAKRSSSSAGFLALNGDTEFPGGFHSYKKAKSSVLTTAINRTNNGMPLLAHNPTILKTKGRGQVDTPQRLVTIATVALKDERDQRRIACRGAHDMYGPPAATDAEMTVNKGQVGMCYLEPGATFRLSLQADSNVRVFTSTAGLPRSGKYGFPCVVQTLGDAENKLGSNQVTVAIEGRQTIVCYCPETVQVGDTLYVDLEGHWTVVDGQTVPAIQGPAGLAPNYANLVVRPMPCSTPNAMFTKVEDMLRLKLGLPEFNDKWKDVKTYQNVCDLTHRMCDFMFANELKVSSDMPIRAYAPIWFLWSFSKMINIHWSKVNIDPNTTNLAHSYIQILRAMIQMVKDIEDKFDRLVTEFGLPLPHTTENTIQSRFSNRNNSSNNKSSIHSHTLTDLLTPTADVKQDSRNIREAVARLDLIVVSLFARIRDEQRNFFVTRCLGTSLSCASGIDPCDVLLGRFG
jgi:hypothetical protein